MKLQDLEAWVLSVADKVTTRQNVEDARIELKTEWLKDAWKAARRLAGHCNAAGGEDVLWIIGLNEKDATAPGSSHNDLASWLPAVNSHFSEIAPPLLHDLNVPFRGVHLSALLFSSARAPYLIKLPTGFAAELEVPWREGTRVRTARREDLLRLLVPVTNAPQVEYVNSNVVFGSGAYNATTGGRVVDMSTLWITVYFYLSPSLGEKLVLPLHKVSCAATCGDRSTGVVGELHSLSPGSERGDSHAVAKTASELLFSGPGFMNIQMKFRSPTFESIAPSQTLKLAIQLRLYDALARREITFIDSVDVVGPTFSK